MSSTECPICREQLIAFVTLECTHKICLSCYHQCIQHSHNKCSLCRIEIKEMNKTLEHISNHKEEIDNLDDEIEYQREEIDKLKELNTVLEEQVDILEYREGYNEELIIHEE